MLLTNVTSVNLLFKNGCSLRRRPTKQTGSNAVGGLGHVLNVCAGWNAYLEAVMCVAERTETLRSVSLLGKPGTVSPVSVL